MLSHLDAGTVELLAGGGGDEAARAHVASCAACRQQVSSARGRRALLGALRPYTLSDLAFRRVEARLLEQAAQPRPVWWPWALGALAVAALALLVVRWPATGPEVTRPPPGATAPAPVAFVPLTVIRAAPLAQVRGDDWAALQAGAVLQAGAALSGGEVTLAAGAWKLRASGALSLGGAASLVLGAGEVTAEVAQPFAVLAGARYLSTADALFSVSRVAAEVVLQVDRGEVVMFDTAGGARRVVTAPARLRWSDGAEVPGEEALLPVEPPRVPPPPWAVFDGASLPAATAITLDGTDLGDAPLLEVVTAGHRQLGLTPPGEPSTAAWVDLVEGATFVAHYTPPAAERPVKGTPDASALALLRSELLRQRPKFSSCYEKWLKTNPVAQGQVTLELDVTASGRVLRARVRDAKVSAAAAECLVTIAKTLVLPPLDADATVQVPLKLRND